MDGDENNGANGVIAGIDQQSPGELLPEELLLLLLSKLDPRSLMITAPQICKRWRSACQKLKDVCLDFEWLLMTGRDVPIEAIVGLQGTLGGWASGLCALFPFTTSVRGAASFQSVHWIALAAKCPGITHVDVMSGNFHYEINLTDTDVAIIGRFLTHVDFSGCRGLTDTAVIALAHFCPELEYIDVADDMRETELSEASLIALATCCPKLMHINFGVYELTDAALELLANKCPKLIFVKFENEGEKVWETDAPLIALVEKCPNMRNADLGVCNGLTDATLVAVLNGWNLDGDFPWMFDQLLSDRTLLMYADQHPELAYIDWTFMPTHALLIQFLDKCPGLKDVVINASRLTDASLRAIAEKCHDLERVYFSGCVNLTDAAVIGFATKCRGLEHVSFKGCINLTDACVFVLAHMCSELVGISFYGCINLTDASIGMLAIKCPAIKSACFENTGVTDEMRACMQQKFPNFLSLDSGVYIVQIRSSSTNRSFLKQLPPLNAEQHEDPVNATVGL